MTSPNVYEAYLNSLAKNAGVGPAAPMASAPVQDYSQVVSDPAGVLGVPQAPAMPVQSFGSGVASAIGGAATAMAPPSGMAGAAQASLGKISGPLDARWASLTHDQQTQALMRAIAQGESGNNYGAKNPHASASGAYQFIDSTWNNFGGYKHAKDAPAAVQDAKARQMIGAYLAQFGYDPRFVVNAWYAGPGNAKRPETWYPGGPNNGLTLGRNYNAKVAYLNAAIAAILAGHGGGKVAV